MIPYAIEINRDTDCTRISINNFKSNRGSLLSLFRTVISIRDVLIVGSIIGFV